MESFTTLHSIELKYNNPSAVGEFQCYDKKMLEHLKNHAEDTGNPLWVINGPPDVPTYNEPPFANNFFLSWYSNQLISHANCIFSLASTVFGETPVNISGKLPLVHPWYMTRSHPSELTAGFYNLVHRDGYEGVIEVFAKNSCQMILPGMELSDSNQPNRSSPRSLLAQIK